MRITKIYRNSFALDESKLRRTVGVIDGHLKLHEEKSSFQFEATLSSGKTIKTRSVDGVLELDNTVKDPIRKLSIVAVAKNGDCSVSFDSDYVIGPRIRLAANCREAAQSHNLHSALEEQAERTKLTGLIYLLKERKRALSMLPIIIAIVAMVGISVSKTKPVIIQTTAVFSLEERLWLSEQDVSELYQGTGLGMAERQLRNLARYDGLEEGSPSGQSSAAEPESVAQQSLRPESAAQQNWGELVRDLAPIIIAILVLGSFVYLVTRTYPRALYLWGDQEEHYKALLKRRQWLWTTIVVGIPIALLVRFIPN